MFFQGLYRLVTGRPIEDFSTPHLKFKASEKVDNSRVFIDLDNEEDESQNSKIAFLTFEPESID